MSLPEITKLSVEHYAVLAEFYLETTQLCRKYGFQSGEIPVGLAVALATARGGCVNISKIATMLHMPRSSVQRIVRRMALAGVIESESTPRETAVCYHRVPEGFLKERDELFKKTLRRVCAVACGASTVGQESTSAA
jgi:predicted transcriptional regulator